MEKFLLIFGIVVFLGSFWIFVACFFGNGNEAVLFYGSILGMLNASIAIAVSHILVKVNINK